MRCRFFRYGAFVIGPTESDFFLFSIQLSRFGNCFTVSLFVAFLMLFDVVLSKKVLLKIQVNVRSIHVSTAATTSKAEGKKDPFLLKHHLGFILQSLDQVYQ